MSKKVLLDTNLLIAAFDAAGTTSQAKRNEARQTIQSLLADPDVNELLITPLIRYEVLRHPEWHNKERYAVLQRVLDGFGELDIQRQVSELAANLYRFDQHDAEEKRISRNLEKRKFDVFHLATAKAYGLELASDDSDIGKLEKLYVAYTAVK